MKKCVLVDLIRVFHWHLQMKWDERTPELQMRWETLGREPEVIIGHATVDGSTVYVTAGFGRHVWAYNLKEDKWTRLPDCPQRNAGLAMVNGLLTAVGGRTSYDGATNTLLSLTESRSEWTEHFPPMPVKLNYPAVVCTGNHLLVTDVMKNIVYVMERKGDCIHAC